MPDQSNVFDAKGFNAEVHRIRMERARVEEERALQWNDEQNAKRREEDLAAEARANPMEPREQRGIAACLIDVCVATQVLPCPMGDCIACSERNAAWEALYRLLDDGHRQMVQRFLVFAEMAPPGVPEEDR